jgi:hypothetical protein
MLEAVEDVMDRDDDEALPGYPPDDPRFVAPAPPPARNEGVEKSSEVSLGDDVADTIAAAAAAATATADEPSLLLLLLSSSSNPPAASSEEDSSSSRRS